jgi:hypothetical protein
MNIFQISDAEVQRDLKWFVEFVSTHIDQLTTLLVGGTFNIPCVPKRVGSRMVPYHYAGKICLLYDYARGKQSLSRDYVNQTCQEFYTMMNMRVSDNNTNADSGPDDDDDNVGVNAETTLIDCFESFLPHPVPIVLLAAMARLKLYLNKPLRAIELEAITGLTPERAETLSLKKVTSENGEPTFLAADVLRVLDHLSPASDDDHV